MVAIDPASSRRPAAEFTTASGRRTPSPSSASADPPLVHAAPIRTAHRRGRAMGSTLQLVVTGQPGAIERAIDEAESRIEWLERRWSRFLVDSELSRLNARAGGGPTVVSPDTALLVERGIEGWRRTGGRFDPSVLRAVVAAGYDRDLGDIGIDGPPIVTLADDLDAGCDAMVVDRRGPTVGLPVGVGFDPGGLGKGLAADLVVEAVRSRAGVDGVLVNLGGDLRCDGQPPPTGDGAWVIALPGTATGNDDEAASDGHGPDPLRLAAGGVATSTCRRRRWRTTTGEAHHLIDPGTRRPARRAADAVTVLAATACDAEILATAVAAAGRLPDDRAMLGDAVVLVSRADGGREIHGPIEAYQVGACR